MKNILWSLQLVRFVSLRASPPISIPFHRNTTVYVLAIFAMCFLCEQNNIPLGKIPGPTDWFRD